MKTARILSIDGGGIRGLIPASILQDWEKILGPIASHFHMLAGTSTGGILATGLAHGNSAESLVKFYKTDGPKIFSNTLGAAASVIGEIYDAAPLEESLKSVFGNHVLSSVSSDLLITAYEMESRKPKLFKSWRARGLETPTPKDDDFPLVSVTRATSAAPTYFQPAHIKNESGKLFTMVDGGVYANNPAMCAFVAARRLYPMADNYLVVSLGTGSLIHPYTFDEVSSWGIAGWAQPLLDVMFSGVSDSTTYELDQLAPEVKQYRFQSNLAHASEEMDNVTPENLIALIEAANQTAVLQSKEMSELFSILKEPLETRESLGYPQVTGTSAPKTFSKPIKIAEPPKKKEVVTVTTEKTDVVPPAIGATGGALLGGAIAGPVGAVVGGIIGGVAGALADKGTEKKNV